MTTESYIVLRAPSAQRSGAVPELLGAGPAAAPAAPDVHVSTQDLSKRDRDDARRDPATLAIAQPMPMRLLEPTEVGPASPADAAGTTWGVTAVAAHTSSRTGSGIKVAVLDTGIDPGHTAFAGVALERRNFTTEGPDDIHGHGTHCAGTIFGRDVDGLRIGVARGVTDAMIGKVLGAGGGSSAQIAEAILWAVRGGASVISMSLGIDFPGFVRHLTQNVGLQIEPATSIALEQYRANINLFNALAAQVEALGALLQPSLIVAASGNESRRPQYEIAVSPPAAATQILSVGALGRGANGFEVADFSNKEVSVSAPGVQVVSAAVGGGVQAMSGTSMATPHVAGVAALWAQQLAGDVGAFRAEALKAQVIARATTAALDPASEAEDVGTGLVQAPA